MADQPPVPKPTFEIGGTTFNTLRSLRDLVSAASKDNVQPQAVLAAEQLGGRFLICAERIDDAVVALRGNDSVRLESVKAAIGLSSGGVRKIVRESSSLLNVFALCVACKLCYLDAEIGSLLFEMMTTTKVLNTFPVSSSQLYMFVKQLSGHSETIVPMDLMHEIAVRVDSQQPDPDTYVRMSMGVLSALLCEVFENLKDEDVREIRLKGHDHGVWLATIILWLIGETYAQVMVDDIHVKGSPDAKMTVCIMSKAAEPWTLNVWKAGSNPKDYVYPYDQDERDTLYRLPMLSTRSYFDQYYWSGIEDTGARISAAAVTRTIAEALVSLVCDIGKVRYPRPCDKASTSGECCCTNFTDVVGTKWVVEAGQLFTKYGWTESSTMGRAQELCETIRMQLPGLQGAQIEQLVRTQCKAEIIQSLGSGVEVDYVFDPALYLAVNALLTSTCDLSDGVRYIEPLHDENLHKGEFLYFSLLTTGLDVRSFREAAFARALPGFRDADETNLVVSRNGYVASMGVLWDCSTKQVNAMRIRICKGDIRDEETVYDRITETKFNSAQVSLQPPTLGFEEVRAGEGSRLRLVVPGLKVAPEFQVNKSSEDNRLRIKQYMVQHNTLTKTVKRRKASWIESADALAVATHIGLGHEIFPKQEQLILRRMKQQAISTPIWCSTPLEVINSDGHPRSVMVTRDHEMMRYFSAGACHELRGRCFHLVIRHEAPLIQCIVQAGEFSSRWVLIE